MKKNMLIMLICVGILFGGIFGYKIFMHFMISHFIKHMKAPPVYVSALKAEYSSWVPEYKAAASLRAVEGVNVTTEAAGMVKEIYFNPGDYVKKGTLLVQLNIDPDVAQLHALQANAELAKITYYRDKAQYAAQAISKQTLDSDYANMKNTAALVDQQIATIALKTIRAPFSGRLGIRLVNLGQYINPGDSVVTLQTTDPVYVDFFVPQQHLAWVKTGLPVEITTESFPNVKFNGVVTTVNPAVDSDTRNIEVEATIRNPKSLLSPGMFTFVRLTTGAPRSFITVPQTAVAFNPYGETIYVIKENGKDEKGKPILTVTQTFIKAGERRGDQIAILEGIHQGDLVVTSGQLKLKNGSTVIINNSTQPANNPDPVTPNEQT